MLTLPIKKIWFDMILSGEKKEEYRNITPYYTTRFYNIVGTDNKLTVKLQNGYSKNAPFIIINASLSIGCGKPEWGAEPNIEYYILSIIDIKE